MLISYIALGLARRCTGRCWPERSKSAQAKRQELHKGGLVQGRKQRGKTNQTEPTQSHCSSIEMQTDPEQAKKTRPTSGQTERK